MSDAIRVGSSVAVQTGGGGQYDPLRGGQATAVYQGDAAQILTIIAGLASWQRFEWNQADPPLYSITVYTPDTAEAPVFELLANFKEKDLFEHPRAKGVSDDDIKTIINFLKRPVEGSDPAVTGGGTGGIPLAMQFYRLLLGGTKKYATEDYVLRYTVTVTNAVSLSIAYADTDKLHVPVVSGGVITLGGVTLPAGIATAIGTIPAPYGGTPTDHAWSWLKRSPTARQTAIGKVVVSGEFWLQNWSTFIYLPA